MTALEQKRAMLHARIRQHRDASADAAGRVLAPLRWIELALRLRQFFRR